MVSSSYQVFAMVRGDLAAAHPHRYTALEITLSRKPFKINFNETVSDSLFEGQAERKVGFTEDHQTSPHLHVLNQGVLKPGLRLPWFLHEDKDEVVVVLEGTGVMHIDGGEAVELNPGDVLNVPAMTRHSLESTGASDFRGVFFKVFV